MIRAGLITAVLLMAAGPAWGQSLSADILPSDEELLIAFQEGRIDIEQYVVLRELLLLPVDADSDLLDRIPNLFHFWLDSLRPQPNLELEQGAPFTTSETSTSRNWWLIAGHRCGRNIDDAGRSRYAGSLRCGIGQWRADLAVRADRSGPERVVARSIEWHSSTGPVRRVTIGSYRERLALGLIWGYRGRILDASERYNGESWAHPDFGGSNGVAVQLRSGPTAARALASLDRDDTHRLDAFGAGFTRTLGPSEIGLGAVLRTITNRTTSVSIRDVKGSVSGRYGYRAGYAEAELGVQAGELGDAAAVVAEGRQQMTDWHFRWAAWWYADRWHDLGGGSKRSSIYRPAEIAEVGLEYNDLRSGQLGGLIHATAPLTTTVLATTGICAGHLGDDTLRVELLGLLEVDLSRSANLAVHHTARLRRDPDSPEDNDRWWHQSQLVVRWKSTHLTIRGALEHTASDGRPGLIGPLVIVRACCAGNLDMSLWLDLTNIDVTTGRMDRSYIFARAGFPLVQSVSIGTKLTHRYTHSDSSSHETELIIETQVHL